MSSLKRNFAYQTLYQILVLLLPFITAPYIARVLGPENSGIYSYCNTIATYFVVFGNLGIEQYGNRTIARVRDNKQELSKLFSELFVLHSITSIICITGYFFYTFVLVNEYEKITLLEGLYVLSVLFDVNWFFFGIEKFKLTVIRNTFIKILSVLSIFIFVKTKEDLDIFTTIMAGSVLLSQIVLFPILKNYVSFKYVKLDSLKKHIIPMLLLFIAVIAANLNRVIDKAMLGWFGFMSDLGCYDYADRIIRMPLGFIAALGTVMLSRMSNLYANSDRTAVNYILGISQHVIVIASFAFSFGLAAVSPDFIYLYLGEEYAETSSLIFILAISIPLVAWNNFVRTQILIPTQRDIVYTKAVLIGAAVNISVNIFAIRFFSAYGAAIATVVSYFVISFIQTKSAKNELDLKRVTKLFFVYLFIGLITFISVKSAALLDLNIIVKLVVELIVGTVVYGLLTIMYIYKNNKEIFTLIMGKRI